MSANGQTSAMQLDQKAVVTAEVTINSMTGIQQQYVAVLRLIPNAVFSTESGAVKPLSDFLDPSFGDKTELSAIFLPPP